MRYPTLLDALVDHANRRPTAPALLEEGRIVTYAELVDLVATGAKVLADAGVARGDRVVLQGPNSVALAVAYFATHAAGAIAVPLDSDLSASSLSPVIEECAPRAFVRASKIKGAAPDPTITTIDLARFATASHAGRLSSPQPADAADILFTTGTTGRPKGVLLTHANIAAAALNISTFLHQDASDIEIVPVPFSHSFGLGRLRCMAFTGNAVVPLAGLRFPAQLADAIVRHRATGLALVPAGMALLRRSAPEGLPALASLRFVELGSAPIASEVRAWALAAMPHTRIVHHYGLTEASRAAYVELASDAAARGSIGVASPNVEIQVRDGSGNPLAPGKEGEIWVRGDMVMRGYWGHPDLTAAALQGGWLRTGDLAVQDEDGFFFLEGRASEMINVGGLKVAPADVEGHLLEHDDILDAACVGVPDPSGISGERVKAFVTSATEIASPPIIAWLRGRGLEAHKIPIAVEQVRAIPRTASGKLLRRLL